MTDPYAIKTVDEVVALVGDVGPTTAAKVVPNLGATERAFIRKCPFLLMATANGQGQVTVSPKGDAPGFVRVQDDTTLVVPERPGNKLIMGYRNMLDNPHVGLIFIIPGTRDTLRVQGRVELTRDPELLGAMAANGKPALLAIRVHVESSFFHCAKAFIRSGLWKPDTWPEDFGFSWGAWAKERYAVSEQDSDAIDETIAADYRNNL
jgi:PPOX class probable FMN-dependent enzyme